MAYYDDYYQQVDTPLTAPPEFFERVGFNGAPPHTIVVIFVAVLLIPALAWGLLRLTEDSALAASVAPAGVVNDAAHTAPAGVAGSADLYAQSGTGGGGISPIFTPEVHYWEKQIVGWAAAYDLDPNLAAIVMQVESCGDPNAVSGAGAQGLFQVMPFHFSAGENMQDPDTNARRGLNYLVEGLRLTNGDVGLAFAGYNGGHGTAAKSWNQWPAETQRYYNWTSGIYEDIQAGLTESPTLQTWLAAGGAALCRQAANRLGLP